MNNIQFNQDIYKRLSPRETEAARAAAEGLTVKETAHAMGITSSAVKAYRARVMSKIGCKTIGETLVSLVKAGIL
jgi:two-component system response regulator FixJ